MFSKSRINEPGPKKTDNQDKSAPSETGQKSATSDFTPSATKAKPPASLLSADLLIKGNLKTTGDIMIEGTVEGDIRAHLLTVGEGATVKGECIADDVIVNGR
ncbi:MAG: bactofilin family protein, partial [Paracoccaceae bacterium]